MPTVSVGSTYYNTTYGKQVMLECKITAYPPVTLVYWQKKIGDVITTLNEGTIGTKGISADMPSLVLMFATTSDSGSYTCYASNNAGTQTSFAAILVVEGANGITTEISNGFPGTLGITLKTPSVTIKFATSADTGRYNCIAENAAGIGQSQSTVLQILACVDGVTVGIPSLTISSVKESMSGEYTCFAINSVVDAGIPQSPSTSDSEGDNNETIVNGVIGAVGAIAAVVAAVIAY
ncbi:unnamed protein product [Mytilus coruscus]|uniref:Ig-like domain-containing protein n=1 Tax=Mytilus coruscus TaxID=42192 RepID=A0A6J8D8V1_MYTCO|nr:unnamed protein product [Mytilus coruscus]